MNDQRSADEMLSRTVSQVAKAVIDIGTNSMRLLVVDDRGAELLRLSRVTGLGRGLEADGSLTTEAMDRTIDALAEYGTLIEEVPIVKAVATSATRDASNRSVFLDRAEQALGVRPEVITGQQEAAFAHVGATAGLEEPLLVVDIGGGSTEFVRSTPGGIDAVSVNMGSVRLTDRFFETRPVARPRLSAAMADAAAAFVDIRPPEDNPTVVAVAGTWSTLASLHTRGGPVHHLVLSESAVVTWVHRLARMSIDQVSILEGIDPARAPVILGGAVVAVEAMRVLGIHDVLISERDLLDGVAMS